MIDRLSRIPQLFLWLSLICAAPGCASSVRSPLSPEDPVEAFLLVDAMHRGLWMPREQGGYVEYGYGEWSWYAEGDDSWYDVFSTIFWPTRGTLGRRISPASDEQELRRRHAGQALERLVVARADMHSLRAELDALVEAWEFRQQNKGPYPYPACSSNCFSNSFLSRPGPFMACHAMPRQGTTKGPCPCLFTTMFKRTD